MLEQIKDTYSSLQELMSPFEELNRRVWGDQITLATTAHVVGGIGIGLLAFPMVRERARPLGYALLGISLLMHLYAFLTPWPASRQAAMRERLRA